MQKRTIDAGHLRRLFQGEAVELDGVQILLTDCGFESIRDAIDAAGLNMGRCTECGHDLEPERAKLLAGVDIPPEERGAFCLGCGLDYPADLRRRP
mgnify:CR=1 FL=1